MGHDVATLTQAVRDARLRAPGADPGAGVQSSLGG